MTRWFRADGSVRRTRLGRWLGPMLIGMAVVLAAGTAVALLEDCRVRLHTLVKLDPPPGPERVARDGLVLSVTGARVASSAPDVVLRAWAPTPAVEIRGAPGVESAVTLRITNLPTRVRLDAPGPVDEVASGTTRVLRFSPRLVRSLRFTAPDADVTFAVLGDTGDDPTLVRALEVAATHHADFLIHLGDLVYEDAQIATLKGILASAPVPVFTVRGNHDYRNRARIEFLRSLGPAYYVFRMGGATFVVLDDADDYLPGLWRWSTQYRWWAGVMGEPRGGPLFVAMHKPPFDRRTPSRHAEIYDRTFARRLARDFARAGTDAVLVGHVHETHLWTERGVPYVVNGEGYHSPDGPEENRMGWIRVHGSTIQIEEMRIWRP